MSSAIVWLRQDLRLADNPALHHALCDHQRVILAYIHAPDEAAPWQPGAAKQWWQHHSLAALQHSIEKLGGKLLLRQGASLAALQTLIIESGAEALYWNRTVEPALVKRDTLIEQTLTGQGVECHSFYGNLLYTPGSIKTQGGKPYQVFTPFWRECQKQGLGEPPLPAPQQLHPTTLPSLPLTTLALLPTLRWDHGIAERWQPGETAAQQQLEQFCDAALRDYPEQRDLPARTGTSGLSPYLANGEITPRQIAAALMQQFIGNSSSAKNVETVIRQLGWREFAHHILHHYPHTAEQPLNERYQQFPWQNNPELLQAWQQGLTGFPIIDAGMRQLWQSGWMHNRVRMVVASFLCKNGLIHWRQGADWFWDTLVDADLASNSLNWQWAAGCGADAAPYFRVFNPVRQSERFDADGEYLRHWLPELNAAPKKLIHQPWKINNDIQQQIGLEVGNSYPLLILDLNITRQQAIATAKAAIKRESA
ncbi:MAG: deoxyribodipyrimidine photo-lyase [Pseudomonadota bacterium]|nr:deoxyribodipyrimidine photo-lyase [Pseudomonadota bacterium]